MRKFKLKEEWNSILDAPDYESFRLSFCIKLVNLAAASNIR